MSVALSAPPLAGFLGCVMPFPLSSKGMFSPPFCYISGLMSLPWDSLGVTSLPFDLFGKLWVMSLPWDSLAALCPFHSIHCVNYVPSIGFLRQVMSNALDLLGELCPVHWNWRSYVPSMGFIEGVIIHCFVPP